jgi:hypothetical protein
MDVLTRMVCLLALVLVFGCQGDKVVVLTEGDPIFVGVVEPEPGDDDSCLRAEEELIDFELVVVGEVEQRFFGVINVCEEPVVVRGIFVDDETTEPVFRVEADRALPFVLGGGDFVDVFAEFGPEEEGEYISIATVLAGGNEIAEVALVGEAVLVDDGEFFP